jgi:hypothetical protein
MSSFFLLIGRNGNLRSQTVPSYLLILFPLWRSEITVVFYFISFAVLKCIFPCSEKFRFATICYTVPFPKLLINIRRYQFFFSCKANSVFFSLLRMLYMSTFVKDTEARSPERTSSSAKDFLLVVRGHLCYQYPNPDPETYFNSDPI